MAATPWPYRFGRGWSEAELRAFLDDLAGRRVNVDAPLERTTPAFGWTVDGSHDHIGTEADGPPEADGLFARARQCVLNYDFSDPNIVEGHFDPDAPALGRNMLLELKVLGFRFLGGCRVTDVRDDCEAGTSAFGFRYDTLEGHIERGFEWFLLTKDHQTGDVHFRIEAHWKLGDFPSWWSRLGFLLIGEHYRERWRRRAPERLRLLARRPVEAPLATPGALAHRGDDEPRRTEDRSTRH